MGSVGVYEAIKKLFVTDVITVKVSEQTPLADKATTPTIYHVTMTDADTEYSQALLSETKKFLIQTSDRSAFKVAFTTDQVTGPPFAAYLTVAAGEVYYEDLVNLTGKTLYFASSSAGKVIEIVDWV